MYSCRLDMIKNLQIGAGFLGEANRIGDNLFELRNKFT